MDMFEEAGGKVEWGNEEFVEVGGLGHSREDIKEGSDFRCKAGTSGEEAEVSIKACGTGMIIARS
jgi:hypothetical protein